MRTSWAKNSTCIISMTRARWTLAGLSHYELLAGLGLRLRRVGWSSDWPRKTFAEVTAVSLESSRSWESASARRLSETFSRKKGISPTLRRPRRRYRYLGRPLFTPILRPSFRAISSRNQFSHSEQFAMPMYLLSFISVDEKPIAVQAPIIPIPNG